MVKWKEDNETTFVNPYTFIPLYQSCKRDDAQELNHKYDLLTGYIECELEVKTPVFIPNATTEKAFNSLIHSDSDDTKSYDFYSYTDLSKMDCNKTTPHAPTPVIPGSEIRGVIRSVYETVTNSCLSTIDVNRILHKRTTVPAKPAFFGKENDVWYLQETTRVKLDIKSNRPTMNEEDYKSLPEGAKLYVKTNAKNRIVEYKLKEFPNCKIGYLHKGEKMSKKKYESVFLESNKPKVSMKKKDGENLFKRLKQIMELYAEHAKDNNDQPYQGYQVNDKKIMLVYYSEQKMDGKTVYYVSPACISQEAFHNTIYSILQKQGQYQPCDHITQVCPACRLFGMVSGSEALSSRIRFTDAHLTDNWAAKETTELFLPPKILDELASPKISATEFYLIGTKDQEKNKKYHIFNYDYAGDWKETRINGKKRVTFAPDESYVPKLRGRKFYWHNEKYVEHIHSIEHQSMLPVRNVVIRPLKKGITFTFKLFFDQLEKDELDKLIWSLNLGDNHNQNCHKIGMGKPHGLGSIKVRVNNVFLRKVELTKNGIERKLEKMEINNRGSDHLCKMSVEALLKVTDFEKQQKNISYPLGEDKTKPNSPNSKASHQWFIGNRSINGSSVAPKVNKTLPDIMDQDQSLPKYNKVKTNGPNRGASHQNSFKKYGKDKNPYHNKRK
jgi:CRISPR-associated protein (TIGR03986 family)